jgi:hypothetical protein
MSTSWYVRKQYLRTLGRVSYLEVLIRSCRVNVARRLVRRSALLTRTEARATMPRSHVSQRRTVISLGVWAAVAVPDQSHGTDEPRNAVYDRC